MRENVHDVYMQYTYKSKFVLVKMPPPGGLVAHDVT